MKNPLFLKCALLALIGALLLIPLAMIEHTIDERTQHRAEAIRAIAASSAGEQSVTGPVLTIPVVEEYDDEQIEEVNGETRKKSVRRKRTHTITVLPRQLDFKGDLNVEKRAYGLHETAVFEMQGRITGSFDLPGASALPTLGQNATLSWGTPALSVSVADARGITGAPKILLAGAALTPHRGTKAGEARNGFHALAEQIDGARPGDASVQRGIDPRRHRQLRLRPRRRNNDGRAERQLAAPELRRQLSAAQPRGKQGRFLGALGDHRARFQRCGRRGQGGSRRL
jgi:inner membrane protein